MEGDSGGLRRFRASFAKLASYPTDYCTETEVAEAVYAAATDESRTIRYLAGADTKLVANLRWTTSEEHYLTRMREMFEPILPFARHLGAAA